MLWRGSVHGKCQAVRALWDSHARCHSCPLTLWGWHYSRGTSVGKGLRVGGALIWGSFRLPQLALPAGQGFVAEMPSVLCSPCSL